MNHMKGETKRKCTRTTASPQIKKRGFPSTWKLDRFEISIHTRSQHQADPIAKGKLNNAEYVVNFLRVEYQQNQQNIFQPAPANTRHVVCLAIGKRNSHVNILDVPSRRISLFKGLSQTSVYALTGVFRKAIILYDSAILLLSDEGIYR